MTSLIALCQWTFFLFITTNVLVSAWSSEPRVVCGQRCLWIPCAADETASKPPIVLIGGLAQTIQSYESHLPVISKERNVLVYECRGQGLAGKEQEEARDSTLFDIQLDNDNYYSNVTLPFQAERLLETTREVIGSDESFDLVGFSLGARICMAAACIDSTRIRRLHLTGVATQRSQQAQVALVAWKELTLHQNLQGFAWSALQTTYSSFFLLANQQRLPLWIDFLCRSNSCTAVHELLTQTHPESPQDPWHVVSMAKRLASSFSAKSGRLLVGELDCMAPPIYAEELASLLKWNPPAIVPASGHAVPTEAASTWRKDVIDFLDRE